VNNKGIEYKFTDKPWAYSPGDSWRLVAMPQEMAKEIRDNLKFLEEGWGRMKATAKVGDTEWQTAIWFDTKHKTYLLPLKAEVRKKEKIGTDKDVEVTVWI
jgi:hypothetical protein